MTTTGTASTVISPNSGTPVKTTTTPSVNIPTTQKTTSILPAIFGVGAGDATAQLSRNTKIAEEFNKMK